MKAVSIIEKKVSVFSKKPQVDTIEKSLNKVLDHNKHVFSRLKNLKIYLEKCTFDQIKVFIENKSSYIYWLCEEGFKYGESLTAKNPKQGEIFVFFFYAFEKLLCFIPVLIHKKWQLNSIARIFAKLLQYNMHSKIFEGGLRLFILWYSILMGNATDECHAIFHQPMAFIEIGIQKPDIESQYIFQLLLNFMTTEVIKINWQLKKNSFSFIFHCFYSIYLKSVFSDVKLIDYFQESNGLEDDVRLSTSPMTNSPLQEIFIKWLSEIFEVTKETNTLVPSKFGFGGDSKIWKHMNEENDNRELADDDTFTLTSSSVNHEVKINPFAKITDRKVDTKSSYVKLQIDPRNVDDITFSFTLHERRNAGVAIFNQTENINAILSCLQQVFVYSVGNHRMVKKVVSIFKQWLHLYNESDLIIKPVPKPRFKQRERKKIESQNKIQIIASDKISPTNIPQDELSQKSDLESSENTDSENFEAKNIYSSKRTFRRSFSSIAEEEINILSEDRNKKLLNVFMIQSMHTFLCDWDLMTSLIIAKKIKSHIFIMQMDLCKRIINQYRFIAMNAPLDSHSWTCLLKVLIRIATKFASINNSTESFDFMIKFVSQTLLVSWIRACLQYTIEDELWNELFTLMRSLNHFADVVQEWAITMDSLMKLFVEKVYNIQFSELFNECNNTKKNRITLIKSESDDENTIRSPTSITSALIMVANQIPFTDFPKLTKDEDDQPQHKSLFHKFKKSRSRDSSPMPQFHRSKTTVEEIHEVQTIKSKISNLNILQPAKNFIEEKRFKRHKDNDRRQAALNKFAESKNFSQDEDYNILRRRTMSGDCPDIEEIKSNNRRIGVYTSPLDIDKKLDDVAKESEVICLDDVKLIKEKEVVATDDEGLLSLILSELSTKEKTSDKYYDTELDINMHHSEMDTNFLENLHDEYKMDVKSEKSITFSIDSKSDRSINMESDSRSINSYKISNIDNKSVKSYILDTDMNFANSCMTTSESKFINPVFDNKSEISNLRERDEKSLSSSSNTPDMKSINSFLTQSQNSADDKSINSYVLPHDDKSITSNINDEIFTDSMNEPDNLKDSSKKGSYSSSSSQFFSVSISSDISRETSIEEATVDLDITPGTTTWPIKSLKMVWRRMLQIFGNVNEFKDVDNHALVFSCFRNIADTLFRLENHLMKCGQLKEIEMLIITPWLLEAAVLPDKYLRGKMFAYTILCDYLFQKNVKIPSCFILRFFCILKYGLNSNCKDIINLILQYCSNKFFTLALPGSTILLATFINAASNLIIDNRKELSTQGPKYEAIKLLSSIITFTNHYSILPMLDPKSEKLSIIQPNLSLYKQIILDILINADNNLPDEGEYVRIYGLSLMLYKELTRDDDANVDILKKCINSLTECILSKNPNLCFKLLAIDMLNLLMDYSLTIFAKYNDLLRTIILTFLSFIDCTLIYASQLEIAVIVKSIFSIQDWVLNLPETFVYTKYDEKINFIDKILQILHRLMNSFPAYKEIDINSNLNDSHSLNKPNLVHTAARTVFSRLISNLTFDEFENKISINDVNNDILSNNNVIFLSYNGHFLFTIYNSKDCDNSYIICRNLSGKWLWQLKQIPLVLKSDNLPNKIVSSTGKYQPKISKVDDSKDLLKMLLEYISLTSPECIIDVEPNINVVPNFVEKILTVDKCINVESAPFNHHPIIKIEKDSDQLHSNINLTSIKFCQDFGVLFSDNRINWQLLNKNDKLLRELKHLDSQRSLETHKIGLIFIGEKQFDKNTILLNLKGSENYEKFLNSLGTMIDLKSHEKFIGGLPKNGSAGVIAPFYSTPSLEVIFHVATLMSVNDLSSIDDKDDVHNKMRHIGNDEVHIIWSENQDQDYTTEVIPTKFGEISIVIYPLPNKFFRIQIIKKHEISPFGPLFNGCMVTMDTLTNLVRATAINAGRSLRMNKMHYQHYYEERYISIQRIFNDCADKNTQENFLSDIIFPGIRTTPSTISSKPGENDKYSDLTARFIPKNQSIETRTRAISVVSPKKKKVPTATLR